MKPKLQAAPSFCLGTVVTHCGQITLCDGRFFEPDDDMAYVLCEFGFALPSRNAFGQAMLPGVIAASARSLEGKMVNLGHMVRSYDRENISRDRYIGHVAAVEPPVMPEGGWTVPATAAEAPRIRAVLALEKAADRVDRILGEHQSGKKPWTVSMEVRWVVEHSAWAWRRGVVAVAGATPIGRDWEALPWAAAPDDLLACWSDRRRRVAGTWGGREVTLLQGGLDGRVVFRGIALVETGMEPPARILEMLAGHGAGDAGDEPAAGAALGRAVSATALHLAAPRRTLI